MKKLLYLFVAVMAFASCQHQEDVACKVQVGTQSSDVTSVTVYMGKKSDKTETLLGSYAATYFVPYGYYVRLKWTVSAYSSTKEQKSKTTYSPSYTFCVDQASELDVKVGYSYSEYGNIYHYCSIGGKEIKIYN